jgi:hypothetical protein
MLRDVNREHLTFCMWCCACKKYKIDVNGRQLRAPYFCTRRCACKKYKMILRDINRESLAFCTWHCMFKKHKIDVKDVNWRPLFFVCVVVRVKSVR